MGFSATRHVVVMGVSGSGKSTVAQMLTERTDWVFAEADEFHPRSNIDKMTSGQPLTDEDRRPWLEALAVWMRARHDQGVSTIITCSALKRSYRELLGDGVDGIFYLHLDGSPEVIERRLGGRSGHFMPPSLLASQIETLEPLADDETGLALQITHTPQEIVDLAVAHLGLE